MSLKEVKTPNFPELEEEIAKYWESIKAFETSVEKSKGKKPYSFYDGPPFATGLPHYGHILAGTMKDIVTRYAHQTGHYVERRFGWDCHGLPIEFEIEKDLGIKTKDEVLKLGIGNYNEKCREIVMRYAGEWKRIITRLGRWIDFDNDYKTMNVEYMESVWWVFKQLWEKDLVYRGFKVMPYSNACTTPLSNFEANMNYQDVSDPAIIISFPLVDDNETSFIAWTTTPWTLPSNLALCVNPKLDYVKIQHGNGNKYILMKSRLSILQEKNQKEFKILEEFKGQDLEGKKYVPLFDYFKNREEKGAFRVVCGSFVTDDAGTGIVHCAPAFGEDDFAVCLENKIIEKGESIPCPIDDNGRFTKQVPEWEGKNIKECDESIIAKIKEMKRLVKKGTLIHSYPFCWRSDTPLIYRVIPSWFVGVEKIKEKLLKNNKDTYWVPENVKEKKFHNWLKDARDWSVSRNRYWGTPLPIWRSDDWEEIICIGSVKELEELSGVKVTDLHRHHIDQITIPSKKGKGNLKRIEEVFDCWFESGSMPYAQSHYPFENKEKFEKTFPADFIAEGIDQTRGWFYTLLILGTALFDVAPWKNLIVNGLVLTVEGKKMSKRLKNYPDPMEVVNKHGADALRLYLINSPVVRAENLCFDDEGVKEIVRSVFIPWFNTYKFFVEFSLKYEEEHGKIEGFESVVPTNVMNKWIISTSQSLIQFVHQEMKKYKLDTVVPKVLIFIDQVSRWYIRCNRKRLKGYLGKDAWYEDLATLFNVLLLSVRAMAPFTPFITETMYQNLKGLLKEKEDSLHYSMLPEYDPSKVDLKIEKAVERMQKIIEEGRALRESKKYEQTLPVAEFLVIDRDEELLKDIKSLESYVKDELNTKSITLSTKMEEYFKLSATAHDKNIGSKLKLLGETKKKDLIEKGLAALSHNDVLELIKTTKITIEGIDLTIEDIKIKREFIGDSNVYESLPESLVLMNHVLDEKLEGEGVCKSISALVQFLRKEAKLVLSDKVNVHFCFEDENDKVAQYLNQNKDLLTSLIKDTGIFFTAPPEGSEIIIVENPDKKEKKNQEMKEKKEKERVEREKKEEEKKKKEEEDKKKKEEEKQKLKAKKEQEKKDQPKKEEPKKEEPKKEVKKEEPKKEEPKKEKKVQEKKEKKVPEKKEPQEKKKKRVNIIDSKLTIYLVKAKK